MLLDYVLLAFRNIRHRKRRSWLTIVGIFIGVAAVVGLVSIGTGLQTSIQEQFEQIGSDKLFISPGGGGPGGGSVSGTTATLTQDDINAIERARGVDQAAGIVFTTAQVEFNDETAYMSLMGVPTDRRYTLVKNSWSIKIGEGRDIRSTDRSSVVVGSRVVDGTFGTDPGLRSKLTVSGRDLRIVGVMESTGDPSVDRSLIVPISVARDLTGKDESFDWVFARIQEGFTPEQVQENVERSLRAERNVEEGEEDFTVSSAQDLIGSFQNILSIVNAVVVGIASISLLVGGIGIMNTMYTSVTERTREIGVMKAIGARRRDILALFLLESGMIGLVGGILGIAVGMGLGHLAAIAATNATQIAISANFGLDLILGSLAFAFLVGTISGVLPARKAASLQPADALRYE